MSRGSKPKSRRAKNKGPQRYMWYDALRGVSPTDLLAQPGVTGERERRKKNQTTEMTHSTLAVENMRRNTNQNRGIMGGI